MEPVVKEKLSRAPPVNIEFQDLNYSLPSKDCKQILKSMNGKFCSGELTAILGPSGSGKTTLLNILAGYILNGVTGSITVNGRPRQMGIFHKISTYIMQEDLLQPHLTVNESIMVAARLKLEKNISERKKQTIVEEVLNLLGLDNSRDTRMENISGGQRKRLSIALEMVSNPPIIFLDEPTSGLDIVSIRQCMDVLRTLTGQGRTVICTVHQPSVAMFQQFDQVYFIADGMCVYNGSTSNIIPFLSSVGLECPTTYSPAEYVIEIVQTNQELVPVLVAGIQNGKTNRRDLNIPNQSSSEYNVYKETTQLLDTKLNVNFATSFWTQFCILFGRMMLQMSRNKLMIWIQVFHHIITGVLFGVLFMGVGNNGALAIANFKYCMSVMVFFLYTHLMSPVLLFPFEVEILKREYFNRWYGLKAYFLALTLRSLPLLMILGLTFILISYLLTNQPMELSRFVWFSLASILVGIASEGLGLAIGSTCSVTNGSLLGPAIAAPCLFLCIYGMGYGSAIEPAMKVLMSTSYLRYGLVAVSHAILGNRGQFECSDKEIYCHYRDPKHLLRDFGMLESTYAWQMLGLSIYLLLFRLIAYLALRYRLKPEISYKILHYTNKILRHR